MSLHVADTYGSDRAGLVWGYAFAPLKAGRPVESVEAERWLAAGPLPDGSEFLWLHFDVTNAASEPWLRRHLSLPDAFLATLRDVVSTRVELADGWLLAVFNDVRFFALDTSDASTVSLCADRRVLVSARAAPLRSIERLRVSVRSGELFRSPSELLAHLLRDQAGILVEIVHELATRVDAIEDKLIAGQPSSCRATLGGLRRVLIRLQRLLAPEPAALFRVMGRPPGWIGTDDVQDLRQSAEELATAVAESAALAERVRLLQEELFALVNEQTSRTLFVLTVVTVLALPLTIISGLLGMNVGGVPLRESAGGFWTITGLAASISAVAAWFAFNRRID